MKMNIIKMLIAYIAFTVVSTASQAQVKGPSETKKQAETEIQAEQKKEKAKKRRYEKIADVEIAQLEQKPKYKRTVKKKERLLLKPVIVSKERKN
ncbi:MAG: hypothetical protein WAQ28_13855 [Bacteroidia bacterium]|jgi:hypothetical protein